MVVVKLTNYPERQPIQRKAQPSKAEPMPSKEDLSKYGTKEKPETAVIQRADGKTEYVKEGKVVAVKEVVTQKAIQTGAPPETTQPIAAAIVQKPTAIPFTQPTRQIPPPDITQFTTPRVIAKEETKAVTPTIDISKVKTPQVYEILQPSPKQPILTRAEEYIKRKTEGSPIIQAVAGATVGTAIGLIETGKEAIELYYQVNPLAPRIKGITPEFNPPEAAAKIIGIAKEYYTEPAHIIPFFAFLDLPKEAKSYYGGGKAIGETALLFIPEIKKGVKIAEAKDIFNLRTRYTSDISGVKIVEPFDIKGYKKIELGEEGKTIEVFPSKQVSIYGLPVTKEELLRAKQEVTTGISPEIQVNPLKTPENIYLPTGQTKLFENKIYAIQKDTGLRAEVKIVNKEVFVYEPYLDKYVEFNPDKYSLVTVSPNILQTKEMIEKFNPKDFYILPKEKPNYLVYSQEKEISLTKFGFPEKKITKVMAEEIPFKPTVYEKPKPYITEEETIRTGFRPSSVILEGEFYKNIELNAIIGVKPHPSLLFLPEEIPLSRVKGVVREIGGVVYNPFERLPSTNRLIPYVVPKYSIYQILEPKQEQPIIQLPKQEIVPYYITDLQPLQITKQKIEASQISAPIQKIKQQQQTIQIPKQKQIQEQIREQEREIVKQQKTEFKAGKISIMELPKLELPKLELPRIKKREEEEPETMRKKGLFGVEVRKRGKFLSFGKRLTEEEAFTLGETITEKTAAASFRITPEEKETELSIHKFLPRSRFYKSTKEKNVFIQLPSKRITSIGEKQEITFKGIEATRRKNVFKLR